MAENKDSNNDPSGEKKSPVKPIITGINHYLLAIENKQAYTSFGKLPLSDENSKPQFSMIKRLWMWIKIRPKNTILECRACRNSA